jgi:mono/diheme cytochrome c family protein
VAHAPNLAVLAPLLSLAACAGPPDDRQDVGQADPDRGRVAMERVGCGACHIIPGIWPEGEVGPRLGGIAGRSLIAGRLPNRPDMLAAFVRNAPALAPGSAMPAMPLSETEARDVAAYLYALDDR